MEKNKEFKKKVTTKAIKNFSFGIAAIVFSFGLLEGVLIIGGYQPKIIFRSFELPAWLGNLDPLTLANYKKTLAKQGFINEDIYAYRFDTVLLRYILKPDIKMTVRNYSSAIFVDKMPKWTIVSNQNGFRTNKKKKRSKNNNFHNSLYVLGDSSSFGWGIEYEETYGSVLNAKLKQDSSTQYRLANYSIPGFSSFQGRVLLSKKIVRIKQGDMILVSYGGNDTSWSMKSDSERFYAEHSFPGHLKRFLNHFIFYKTMKLVLLRNIEESENIKALNNQKRRVSLKEYEQNLKDIFNSIQQKGAKAFFVKVCTSGEYAARAKKISAELNVPFFSFPELMLPDIDNVLKGEILPAKFQSYFNSYGELMEKDKLMTLIFPDYCHPNAIGHYLMGEIIYKYIKKHRLFQLETGS